MTGESSFASMDKGKRQIKGMGHRTCQKYFKGLRFMYQKTHKDLDFNFKDQLFDCKIRQLIK